MIGLTTEYKLATLLQALYNGEKDIEISRQVLAERSAFEPYTAFKRLTRLATSSLTVYQVVDFLRENEFSVVEKDVRNIFRLYSTGGDGRLSYTDFLELVLPRNNSYIREVCTQRDSYYVADDEILPYEVELGLAKIFDKEINLSRKTELLREDLVSRYDFSLRAAYEAIVESGDGRADYDGLYNFLQKNNISVIEKDIIALLRRVDADRDGRLAYSEFSEAVLPADEYYRRVGESATRTKPALRTSTPQRTKVAKTSTGSHFYSPSKKLSNADYQEYLSDSKAFTRSTLRSTSPIREAMSPKREKVTKTVYQTPTKTRSIASPVRGRSPARLDAASPMKGNEEEHLANALREQVELDKELESAKNKLALQEDFNLFDAFRFFDSAEKGYITRLELKEGLNDFELFPTSNELYLIMKKYNKSEDGLLKYSEFSDLLKPKDAGYAALLTDRRPTYVEREDLAEIFSKYTVELYRKLFRQVIETEYHSEKIRQRLSRRPLFDAYDAFEALDKNRSGFITRPEFRELLSDHGFYATQKEVNSLLNRYDKNEDGKVSYTEFVREITPKSPERV
jgi:Ca2+-binding EF-hand superfamily protein